jgi:hypothetical protein
MYNIFRGVSTDFNIAVIDAEKPFELIKEFEGDVDYKFCEHEKSYI